MGIFDKLFGKKEAEDTLQDQLWRASPQSECEICGKKVRGLSGGYVSMRGADFQKMMESDRYVCPKCGLMSCFMCCADMKVSKVICSRCKSEMSRG